MELPYLYRSLEIHQLFIVMNAKIRVQAIVNGAEHIDGFLDVSYTLRCGEGVGPSTGRHSRWQDNGRLRTCIHIPGKPSLCPKQTTSAALRAFYADVLDDFKDLLVVIILVMCDGLQHEAIHIVCTNGPV